jgi:hypothetical protein
MSGVHVCPACGNANFGASSTCTECGAPLEPVVPSGSGYTFTLPPSSTMAAGQVSSRPSPRPWVPPRGFSKRAGRRYLYLAIIVGIIVVLLFIPYPHSFSFSLANLSGHAVAVCFGQPLPYAVSISFTWTIGGAPPTTLTVSTTAGVVYTGSGQSGYGTFTSDGQTDYFCVPGSWAGTLQVQGNYNAGTI